MGYRSPPGFGLRQSPGALEAWDCPGGENGFESEVVRLMGKRQGTAAVQDAVALLREAPGASAI